MKFHQAVCRIQVLSDAYKPGLKALKEIDKNRLECRETRRLTGSVNLEETFRSYHPDETIWDYGIGWKKNQTDDVVIWIEVHPASSSHIREIIAKVAWLKKWLNANDENRNLSNMTRKEDGYVWIASGRVSFQRTAKQARQLAQAGVSFPREKFILK
jgi:hypothetical protein